MFVLLAILALASAKPQGFDYTPEGTDDGLAKGEKDLQDCVNNSDYPNGQSYSRYVNDRVERSIPNLCQGNLICYPSGSSSINNLVQQANTSPLICSPVQQADTSPKFICYPISQNQQFPNGQTSNLVCYPTQNVFPQPISSPIQQPIGVNQQFPGQTSNLVCFPAQNVLPQPISPQIQQPISINQQFPGQTSNLVCFPSQNVIPQQISPAQQTSSLSSVTGSVNSFLDQVFHSVPSLADYKCTVIPGSSFNLGPSCQVTPLYTITMINDNVNVC